MKFTKNLFEIIKNCSTISEKMLFVPGKEQTIVQFNEQHKTKIVCAIIRTDVEIEKQFGIFDLSKFLSVLSLFDEPEIEIGNDSLTIKSTSKFVKYKLAHPDFVKNALLTEEEKKVYESIKPFFEFELKYSDLHDILKLHGVLIKDGYVIFGGDGEKLYLSLQGENDHQDSGRIDIGTTSEIFERGIRPEFLKIMKNDYNVGILKQGPVIFKSPAIDYFIPHTKKISK